MPDFIIYYIVWLSVIFLYHLYKARQESKEEREFQKMAEKRNRKAMEKLLENRKVVRLEEDYNTNDFWELIDRLDLKSKGIYKNQLGLFKDVVRDYSESELIELNNVCHHIYRKSLNWDVLAACFIIIKRCEIGDFLVFVSWLISKGQVFYNNVILDVNLITNREFYDLNDVTYLDVIAEIYFKKTGEFIPEIEVDELELKGEGWNESDLPIRYSKLWTAYWEA